MKWTNFILYIGIICVFLGFIMAVFAETGRYQFIAGVSVSGGLIISVLGWVFYNKKTPSAG